MQSSEGVSQRKLGLLSSYLEPHTSEEDVVKNSKSPTDIRASFARKYKIKQEKPLVTTSTTVRIALDLPTPTISKTQGVSAHRCFRGVSALIMYECLTHPVQSKHNLNQYGVKLPPSAPSGRSNTCRHLPDIKYLQAVTITKPVHICSNRQSWNENTLLGSATAVNKQRNRHRIWKHREEDKH